MKPSTFIYGIAALTSNIFVAAMLPLPEAKAICGDLGVMNTTNVPEGVDSDKIRTCAEHPLGKLDISLEKRSCWFGKPVGCKWGYCWKSCAQPGSGEWCWTAADNGFGKWLTCKSDNDCGRDGACGAGGCKSCGCSC